VDNPAAYVNHDWIKSTGTLIEWADREQSILAHHKGKPRPVHAHNVGEVHRLIEYEQGNLHRRPIHRILDDDDELIQDCQIISAEEILKRAREQIAERFKNASGYTSQG